MKKTKKALASLAIASMALTSVPFNAFAAGTVPNRIAGVTAEQTAVQIADQTGYTGAAILASSTSYGMVDALTAGPLAASLKAPILLTGAGSTLDAATKAELTKLAVKTVYVTSGTAVIKQGVIDELKGMGITVEQLGGVDRSETSVNIAKKMTGVTKVAVANGLADALSIASVAAAANEPILLTNKDALPSSVSSYLTSAGITASDVIGGTGVISDAVAAALPGATRHFGATAYDTNNQVIQDFASSLKFDNVYVANGQTGIDALAGAPLAAQTNSAIVLSDGKSVPAAAAFTYSKSTTSSIVTALGGEAVVPEGIRSGVAAGQVTPVSGELSITSVSGLDDTNQYLGITFSKPVTRLEAADITIQNADSLARYGVESVSLSSNGLNATVALFARDTATPANPVLAFLQDYNVTVNANGQVLKAVFNRPMFQEGRVSDVDPSKRTVVVNAVTVNIPASVNFDFQAALGEKVRVWYDEDRNLVNFVHNEETVVTGKLEVTTTRNLANNENGKVEIDGVEYKLGDTLTFENNDAYGNIGVDGTEYDYARCFFDKNGNIERVVSYDWDNFFVVSSTDGDAAISFDNDELDLSDYILMKGDKTISVKDLQKGDVVYYNSASNDGDGVAEVFNKTVTGPIDTVYSNKVKINGTNYVYIGGEYGDAQYLDGDEFKAVDSDKAEEFQAGGDVKVYLDRFNEIVYIEGTEGTVASNTKSTFNTDNVLAYLDNGLADRGTIEIESKNDAGDVFDKTFRVGTLDKVSVTSATGQKVEYQKDEHYPGTATDIEEFRLTAAGGGAFNLIAVDSAYAQIGAVIKVIPAAGTDNTVMEYTVDDSGNMTGINFLTAVAQGATDLALDDDYISLAGGAKLRLQSDTVVYKAQDGFDDANGNGVVDPGEFDPSASDITVTTWGAIAKDGYDILTSDAYSDKNGNVAYLVIKQTNASDETATPAVITSVLKNKDLKVVEINAMVAGEEKTYEVDELNVAINKGDSVVLNVNDNSQLVDSITTASAQLVAAQKVVSIDLSTKEVLLSNGNTYKLTSDGKVYDATDVSDISAEAFRDIKLGDTVDVVLDEAGTWFAKDITVKTTDDVVAPTVVTKLAAAGSYVANAAQTLRFSEALNATSQAAVKAAVDAAYTANGTATVTSAWDVTGTTLTVTITAAAAPNDVVLAAVANIAVTDVAGNASAALSVQN